MLAMQHCRPSGLYLITAPRYPDASRLLAECELALDGGASMLQFRDKSADWAWRAKVAGQLRALCARYSVPLMVNDDVELALSVGAAGVHLGRDDASIAHAKACLPSGSIIGVSCYNRPELAVSAAGLGADYLAFGSMFPSASKPVAVHCEAGILTAARPLGLPLVAIGGITAENGASLIAAGANYLAVIGAVFDREEPQKAAESFSALWNDRHLQPNSEQEKS